MNCLLGLEASGPVDNGTKEKAAGGSEAGMSVHGHQRVAPR
jgi:hypothetical protein